jgi:putative phosphoribosyl transferase
VRKLGVPGHDELAFRAIATGGTRVLNQQVESLRIPLEWIEAIDAKERRELELRDRVYRGERAPPDLAGARGDRRRRRAGDRLDDAAAVRAVREDDSARVVVAVPVADPDVCAALNSETDEAYTGKVLRLNRLAQARLGGESRLEIVPAPATCS